MLAIAVEQMPARVWVYDDACIAIGRSTRNDVVLPNRDVSRNHARITQSEGRFLLEDLDSNHGTFVNGERIRSRLVAANDRISIGPFTLCVRQDAVVDLTERRLLAAITQQQDSASRHVYADWLEGRGDLARAEFLRVQEALVGTLDDLEIVELSERLRELCQTIEVRWRYAVARPAIEKCETRFSFKCPREWGALAATDRADVRHCNSCNKNVYYCTTIDAARKRAEAGDCVAVDVLPKRSAKDLADRSGESFVLGRIA